MFLSRHQILDPGKSLAVVRSQHMCSTQILLSVCMGETGQVVDPSGAPGGHLGLSGIKIDIANKLMPEGQGKTRMGYCKMRGARLT